MKSIFVLATLCLVASCFDIENPPVVAEKVACSYKNMSSGCKYTNQDDWSFLLFVQSWPGNFCNDGCCRLPETLETFPYNFTIHGLWPNYAKTGYPSCCKCDYTDKQVQNMLNSDRQLQEQLEYHWPAMKRCNFVRYEFEKHGTCATTHYDGEDGPIDYWYAALNLKNRYNLLEILTNAGITPGGTYNTKDIKNAIEKELGVSVIIACTKSALQEVRICVKRDDNKREPALMDCPSELSNSEMCKTKSIAFEKWPTFLPGGCPFL